MITFNGTTKQITITDETSIDVRVDLYSAWKRWAVDHPNYLRAMRVVGGDDLGNNASAPAFYFMTNGWVVVADGCDLDVKFNLFSDDYESPFVKINGATVLNQTSTVPTVAVGSGLSKEEHDELMSIKEKLDSLDFSGVDFEIKQPPITIN